jgi:hypothetical protein
MDSVLRPYDLGSTQWYVLYQLANDGPTMQRDLVRMLQIERVTLSGSGALDRSVGGIPRSRRISFLARPYCTRSQQESGSNQQDLGADPRALAG